MTILFYGLKSSYYEFSNFYKSKFNLDGEEWMNVEHYFQAHKFVENNEYYNIIRDTNTPNKAFILAKQKKKRRICI